eukprot:scaffold13716_cov122-Isochrysis_galbana.AAC.7
MLPPRSYRPPIATRGPRVATRGRKLPRSSLGFRGALWGGLRALWGWKIPNSYQILFATRNDTIPGIILLFGDHKGGRLVGPRPHRSQRSHGLGFTQSGMVQPVVQEMFATVHAAGSSLLASELPTQPPHPTQPVAGTPRSPRGPEDLVRPAVALCFTRNISYVERTERHGAQYGPLNYHFLVNQLAKGAWPARPHHRFD